VAVSRSLRAPLVGVIVALVAGLGAVAGSRILADDDGGDVIRLESPGEYVDPEVSNPPHDGETFPAVQLVGASGSATTLRGDGRPMVVNLWYSTCPPCARELTYFATVADDLGAEVRFVGVNPLDDDSTMRRFATERGVGYELLRDPEGALDSALGIVQYPATFFVDADGEVVAQTGVLSEGGLRDQVAELLS
jgi:peroxiredoxin